MKQLTLSPQFEEKLQRLPKPPVELLYIGEELDTVVASKPIVAVVGTRKPTAYGKQMTASIVEELVRNGVVICSGNALGIDVLAQKTALEHNGKIISIVPSGLNNIYPATNRPIVEKIVKNNGIIITEYEKGHVPRPEEFLARNRLIAALSDYVLIPEAAERSGSLNTAKHAKEIGVPVGAVPGNIGNPMSGGTNSLIANKDAQLVRSASDILKNLDIDETKTETASLFEATGVEADIINAIKTHGAATISIIQSETSLDTAEIQRKISMLEIKGAVRKDDAGNWHITKTC